MCFLLDFLLSLDHLFRTLLTEIFKNDTKNIYEISGISYSAEWSPSSQSRTPWPTTIKKSQRIDSWWKTASSVAWKVRIHLIESPESTSCHVKPSVMTVWQMETTDETKLLFTRNNQNRRSYCSMKIIRCNIC